MTISLPHEKRTAFGAGGRSVSAEISEEMAKAIGCRAGLIVLLNGVEGRTGGFGFAHISAKESRAKHIQNLRFPSIQSFVQHIVESPDYIGLQSDGRIVLVRKHDGYYCHVICQWDEEISKWSVTTALPKRNMRDVIVRWPTAT